MRVRIRLCEVHRRGRSTDRHRSSAAASNECRVRGVARRITTSPGLGRAVSSICARGGRWFRVGQELAQDLDLYLRVARLFPVHCHEETITEYRRHSGNTSARSPSRALRAAHATLERQRTGIDAEPQLLAALEDGKRYFNEIFGESIAFEIFESSARGGSAARSPFCLSPPLRTRRPGRCGRPLLQACADDGDEHAAVTSEAARAFRARNPCRPGLVDRPTTESRSDQHPGFGRR